MTYFRVTVERAARQQKTVIVEAEDERSAKSKGADLAGITSGGWSPVDDPTIRALSATQAEPMWEDVDVDGKKARLIAALGERGVTSFTATWDPEDETYNLDVEAENYGDEDDDIQVTIDGVTRDLVEYLNEFLDDVVKKQYAITDTEALEGTLNVTYEHGQITIDQDISVSRNVAGKITL